MFWPFSTFPGIVPSLPCPSSLATTVATNARNHDLAQGLRQATRPSRIWNNFVTLKTRYVAKSQNLERRRKRNGKCEMGIYVKHTASRCRPHRRPRALALESVRREGHDRPSPSAAFFSLSVRLAIEGSGGGGGGGAFCGRQRSRLWLVGLFLTSALAPSLGQSHSHSETTQARPNDSRAVIFFFPWFTQS